MMSTISDQGESNPEAVKGLGQLGQTSEFGYTWPELADLADGPSALQLIAQEVDAKQTTLRRVDFAGTQGWVAGPGLVAKGAEVDAFNFAAPLAVIGWAEIDFTVSLNGDVPPASGTPLWAGYLRIYVDGVMVKLQRFASQGATNFIETSVRTAVPVQKAATALTIRGTVNPDGSSVSNVYAPGVSWELRQFGAIRG